MGADIQHQRIEIGHRAQQLVIQGFIVQQQSRAALSAIQRLDGLGKVGGKRFKLSRVPLTFSRGLGRALQHRVDLLLVGLGDGYPLERESIFACGRQPGFGIRGKLSSTDLAALPASSSRPEDFAINPFSRLSSREHRVELSRVAFALPSRISSLGSSPCWPCSIEPPAPLPGRC